MKLLVAVVLGGACTPDSVEESKPPDGVPDSPVDSGADSPGDSVDTEDSGVVEQPGVWRLGPPAPSVGIYGVAAHPDGDRIYVSNLHVPWITVIDPTTGAWADALSLAEAGSPSPWYPILAVTGRTLWASAADLDLVLRWDVDSHEALPALAPEGGVACIEAAGDALWVGTRDWRAQLVQDEAVVASVDLPHPPSALSAEGEQLAWLAADAGEVGLVGTDGVERWHRSLAGSLQDVLLLGDTVYVTEREAGEVIALVDGEEVGRVHTGSDSFALAADGAQILVSNRQGAALPASGAYEGDPGRVTALSPALEPLWTVDLDRTIHFLAFDGRWWWTADEDALRMSAFDSDGVVQLLGPRVGLTLDSLRWVADALYLPSHLSDELWILDDGGARVIDTCAWPFVAVASPEGEVWVPCQMDGDLLRIGSDGASERIDVAATFHTACGEDGLCTGHDWLLDASWYEGQLWWSDPYLGAIRAWDGTILPFETEAQSADHAQHLALLAGASELYLFEPRDQRIIGLGDGRSVSVSGATADFAMVGGAALYAGDGAYSEALERVGDLPGTAVAAGELVYVQDDWDLVALREEVEVARLALTALRVPPDPAPDGSPRPMRFALGPDGALWVANVMRGTLERRDAESLAALGTDEIRAVGRWAELPGLR